jgi:hypothetical protein
MPVRNVIGSAVELGRKAVVAGLGAASRLRGQRDTPVVADAPKPGEPGGPKSGTARRTPAPAAKRTATRKAKKPAAKPSKPAAKRAKRAKPAAKRAAKKEPAATANGAGATEKPGAVSTGQAVTSETPPAKPAASASSRSS